MKNTKKNAHPYLDKMVDWILTNAHCTHTGYADDGIEAIYRMKDGTEYRILLDMDYEVAKVALVA